MTIVPPIHNSSNTIEDHMERKASVPPREESAHIARKIWTMDRKRIVYLFIEIEREKERERERERERIVYLFIEIEREKERESSFI
jgi:hypothetical protein